MSFITKKFMPRRTFLRGVGATMALPLLESMVPAATPSAQTAANPVRRFHFLGGCRYAPENFAVAPLETKRFQFAIF